MSLCYRDRSYCASDCVNHTCSRFVSPAIAADAARLGLPISYTDYRTRCGSYIPPGEPPNAGARPNTARPNTAP